MASVALDPELLYFANTLSRDELLSRFELLERIRSLEKSFNSEIALASKNTVLALVECNAFPVKAHIKHLLDTHDHEAMYSALDITRLITNILDRTDLEGNLAVNDLIPTGLVGNQRPDPASALPRSLQDECDRVMALVGVHNRIGSHEMMIFSLAADVFPISFTLDAVDPDPLHPVTDQGLPIELECHLKNAFAISNLLTTWSYGSFWENATDIRDIYFAIRLRCADLLNGELHEPKFTVGNHFIPSLRENQAFGINKFSSVVLTKSAMVLAKPLTQKTKPMLNGDGNQIVRSSDSARAMRAHITKDGVALRLMYWELDGGSIELANIGPKHELWIAE